MSQTADKCYATPNFVRQEHEVTDRAKTACFIDILDFRGLSLLLTVFPSEQALAEREDPLTDTAQRTRHPSAMRFEGADLCLPQTDCCFPHRHLDRIQVRGRLRALTVMHSSK